MVEWAATMWQSLQTISTPSGHTTTATIGGDLEENSHRKDNIRGTDH